MLTLFCFLSSAFAGTPSEALMMAGRVEEAIPVAREEALAGVGDLDAHERYIDLLLTVGMAGLAEQTYRERMQDAPTDPDAHYLLGRAVTSAKDAQAAYEHALRMQPEHARAHMGMAAVYRATGAPVDAEAAYRRALALDGSLSEAWVGLGSILVMTDRREEALSTARQAMVAVPHDASAYIAVSLLAPAEAVQTLQLATRKVPGDPRVHETLAEALLATGDAQGAVASAAAALGIDPSLPGARLVYMYATEVQRGALDSIGYSELVALRRDATSNPAGALAGLDGLAERYPKSSLVRMARAQPRAATGDLSGAKADLAEAMQLDPTNSEAAAALGLLHASTGEPASAKPLLAAAVEARPSDASLGVALAKAELAVGEAAAAASRLEALWQTNPRSVDVLLTYAGALAATKESDKAYRVLRDGLQSAPDARVVLALAAAARDVGRFEEAADLVDQLAKQSGQEGLSRVADQLRAQGQAASQP